MPNRVGEEVLKLIQKMQESDRGVCKQTGSQENVKDRKTQNRTGTKTGINGGTPDVMRGQYSEIQRHEEVQPLGGGLGADDYERQSYNGTLQAELQERGFRVRWG